MDAFDAAVTPPLTAKHTGFMETPEPFVAAREKPVVSFRAAELQSHATASISVVDEGTPIKAVVSPQHWQQLKDVLQWHNPAVSALAFLLGTFVALAVEFVLRGDHKMTPLKALSYALLADLALNFLRSMVSSSWHSRAAWTGSDLTRQAAEGAQQAVLRLAQWHDTFLSARNPALTLRIAAALCALSLLSSIFSMWRMVCIAFFGAFAWGAASEVYGAQIIAACKTATNAVQVRWDALHLSRRQKAAALMVTGAVLWLNVPWALRAQALLLGALIIRCNLKPAEVSAIISHAEPYVHSAKKRARRLSIVAGDMLRRHSSIGVPQSKMHAK